jgi:histidinol dehydrogenase
VIRLLRTAELSPDQVVAALARPPAAADPDAVARVAAIVDEVRRRGDAAVIDFT